MLPRYPLYIVSKGRWDFGRRLTSRALERMNLPYFIVVEQQEADKYAAVVNPKFATILILDPTYQREYQTCDDLGDTKGKGPGPARNFAWDHSIADGHAAHWVMDDNIQHFARFHQNMKIPVHSGAFFRAMEDFVNRYENVAMSGPNYWMFATRKSPSFQPFTINTRIYSCNLIRNDVSFRWRGRYNEDTILSLDMMQAGWCTVQFNAFLQFKRGTQEKRGGNTDEFYAKEGTLPKSKMLVEQYPDVARLVWKWNRWHHHVDYRRFRKNKLVRKPDAVIPDGVNEYGMRLVRIGAN